MSRIVIFGNSGSGKTSLAKRLSGQAGCPRLDLDSIAWKESNPPVREELGMSHAAIDEFIDQNPDWIVEGCYASLVAHAAKHADQMIFLNPGVDTCVSNCRSRPWEPEKYQSIEAQDENLDMLIEWVKSYETREDEFSLHEHRKLFNGFDGPKCEIRSNDEAQHKRMESKG